jgi:subtilisin family serine protease
MFRRLAQRALRTGRAGRLRPGSVAALAFLALVATLGAASAMTSSGEETRALANVERAVVNKLNAHGSADFWIVFDDQADLSNAAEQGDWKAQGRYVHEQLTEAARRSQADVGAKLEALGVEHESFWAANAILVRGGNRAVLDAVRAGDGVAEVRAPRTYAVPRPTKGADEPSGDGETAAVEWGVANIGADRVWADFGVRGEGIVIGSIDTGVQVDHAALAASYRGNVGRGGIDHNYNWWDPSTVCAFGEPCDNHFAGHGTHTTGTLVGADGANQIGVAPGARWMAAKGCEGGSCSDFALLSSAQFMLAPTNLGGENPRPDLRPHVVNNSWGEANRSGVNPLLRDAVKAWTAAGIFAVFATGNSANNVPSPFCDTTDSPADLVESWAVGAHNSTNTIAPFSGRGPGENGTIKPELTAPGVDVRSSVAGDAYETLSGTSMAAPHVAGAVGLMWSAAPTLAGDIAETMRILATTAVDVDNTTCGGTAGNNNVWGEGRLDAYAAVAASPRGVDTGVLTGTVRDGVSGQPIEGAEVSLDVDGRRRSLVTGATGRYTLGVRSGNYQVTARAYGWAAQTKAAQVVADETLTVDFALVNASSHTVAGRVVDEDGDPVGGAAVTIGGAPLAAATTAADGTFAFVAVAAGSYDVAAGLGTRCSLKQVRRVVVDGDEQVDFTLSPRRDAFGYTCRVVTPQYIEATGATLPLSGEEGLREVQLPFAFPFYGQRYSRAYVAVDGLLAFRNPYVLSPCGNKIPQPRLPNAAVSIFCDSFLRVDAAASVRTDVVGTAPGRRFVVEWRNMCRRDVGNCSLRVDFEVVLFEDGRLQMHYRGLDGNDTERGRSAEVGIENEDGTIAYRYSSAEPALRDEIAILYRTPQHWTGAVKGAVRDVNDGQAVAGATVRLRQDDRTIRRGTSGADGGYDLSLVPPGSYMLETSADHYETESTAIEVERDDVVVRNVALDTGRAAANPTTLDISVPAGEVETRSITLANTGSVDLEWTIQETEGFSVVAGPTAPGDVLRTWDVPEELRDPVETMATGVRGDNLWMSAGALFGDPASWRIHELTSAGVPTGRSWVTPRRHPTDFGPRDMAYDAGRDLMCHGDDVGADRPDFANAILCWDPDTGQVVDSLTIPPRRSIDSLHAVAYRADDDSFYIWGNELLGDPSRWEIRHIKGLSHPDKGALIDSCYLPIEQDIYDTSYLMGLEYHAASRTLWAAPYGHLGQEKLYRFDPETCEIIAAILHPRDDSSAESYTFAMDANGDLWVRDLVPASGPPWPPPAQLLVDGGAPNAVDVGWLQPGTTSGTIAPDATQAVEVIVDATDLEPGTHDATVFVRSNSGRGPLVRIPVRFEVTEAEDPPGSLDGTVVDANDEEPVGGVTVTATGAGTHTATTSEDGGYALELPAGSWTVTFGKDRYTTETREVVIDENGEHRVDVSLRTGVASVDPDAIARTLPPDTTESVALSLANSGTAELSWLAGGLGDVSWLEVSPASGNLATGATVELTLSIDTTGLEPGQHTAELALSTSAARRPNLSVPVTITVEDDGGEPPAASQDIVATVPDEPAPGSLVLSVDPNDRTVTLPPLALGTAGDRLATSGSLRPVTIIDTRVGTNPGWDVSGQASDFEASASAFGAGFLGWTPLVASQSEDQTATPGAQVAPGFPSGQGLSVPQVLATAPDGAGVGTAVLGAGLSLEIPVETPAGTYTATLTLTAI